VTVSRGHIARIGVGLCGGAIALSLLFATHPLELAFALALPVFLLVSLLSERAYRALVTPADIQPP
jgi:hypothetical protein